ncbi:MAG: hypothetical protein ABSE39_03225 [Candidatus Bathyarchaeia archaeon]|jgi:hypothetical protein
MISANDAIQIISEIHQYSMLLVEFRDATTLGIVHSAGDKMTYFKFQGALGQGERDKLVETIYSGEIREPVKPLALEEFLREIEGRKAKHIWLETGGAERKEHGFMSISELKAFFRGHTPR